MKLKSYFIVFRCNDGPIFIGTGTVQNGIGRQCNEILPSLGGLVHHPTATERQAEKFSTKPAHVTQPALFGRVLPRWRGEGLHPLSVA